MLPSAAAVPLRFDLEFAIAGRKDHQKEAAILRVPDAYRSDMFVQSVDIKMHLEQKRTAGRGESRPESAVKIL
jgi:hypothetical protein